MMILFLNIKPTYIRQTKLYDKQMNGSYCILTNELYMERYDDYINADNKSSVYGETIRNI